MESKILKEIVKEYELEDGMDINLRCLDTISKRKNIELIDLFKILGICRLDEYLNMEKLLSKNNYTIYLYTESELYKIKEEIKLYLNNDDSIDNNQFKKIQKKYKIENKKLKKMLGIEFTESKKRKLNMNLLAARDTEKTKNKIFEFCKGKDYVTKNDVLEMEGEIKAYKTLIRKELSISSERFGQLMNNKIGRTRIISYDTNKKIFLAKMDFKYYDKYDYLTCQRLRNKCYRFKIKYDDFLKNLNPNINHYKYNKMAIEKNQNGIFIGSNKALSKEFIEANYIRIKKIINMAFGRVTSFYYQVNNEKEEIESEVFFNIVKNCGVVEKILLLMKI